MYIANNITTALYKNLARNNYLKNKDSKTCGLEPNTILHICLKDNTVNQGFVAPCKETLAEIHVCSILRTLLLSHLRVYTVGMFGGSLHFTLWYL